MSLQSYDAALRRVFMETAGADEATSELVAWVSDHSPFPAPARMGLLTWGVAVYTDPEFDRLAAMLAEGGAEVERGHDWIGRQFGTVRLEAHLCELEVLDLE